MTFLRVRIGFALAALSMGVLLPAVLPVHAASVGPQRIVYDAHLLNSSGDAITTAHSVRFSWWTSADSVAGDTTATGTLNTSASAYANWQEVHTVTPDSNGYFSVELGSVTALPDLSTFTSQQLQSLYLQVEVKASGVADTSYELLDRDASDSAVDRSPIDTVPFALNADRVDSHDTGTASGSIPVLQSGGLLSLGMIPSGTDRNEFTIDADDSASGSLTLRFGTTLSKELTYDQSNGWFNFNDDVRIEGSLTVTGLINGIDIATLGDSVDTHLKVASGAGLTVSIAGGSYRINSAITDYAGSGSVALSDETTNYLFFTETGLTVNTIGFPTDKSYIPLAAVTAAAGSITGVTDRRVLQSDDRERTVESVFHPQYANAALQGDATNNVGQLSVDHDEISKNNYYRWTSTVSTLQDYDVIVRVTLPPDFKQWTADPLSVTYRSTSADSAENKLDVSVFDTNGTPVVLSGATTDLAGTSWATTNVDFLGSPVWTAGNEYLIKFKMYARGNAQMHLGALKLQYREFLSGAE
ncbi:hypothetical protein A2454_00960 [Candidatus Peribacteria bacterium RIFOXYC2_FULL_55_14]|nr:MAG: hypothetical protein UY90_C0042G0006 [Candidatus Peregrinibacteria bacterium GW2011_GWA2_54_9]OGJ73060.1 MAG: hypothetical protein A2198_02755 [Candidatus Peribacteria bacterium RIFOXYA1_FULL_56_14]OGJ74480.1 MAG: hypothetical protein A2217_01185 [Candidatus Peribacteria bacterium RIFOXYA2_FULL_55_28]OGJ75685.1 MAG: hypothetical protein A2384_03890 [Candidatus Peribacteria bacterium RIFOXYB1_FULL_54_35]OGJ76591.1 MAG: hypothetical protein A2327_02410 [Candidatus Peribacteria bacterium R